MLTNTRQPEASMLVSLCCCRVQQVYRCPNRLKVHSLQHSEYSLQGNTSIPSLLRSVTGLPLRLSSQESIYQCRRCAWIGKIPRRRAWQPTPIFLPGNPHGQRNPTGYSPRGCRVRRDLVTDDNNSLFLVTSKSLADPSILINFLIWCK